MCKGLEALEKIDHTICMNNLEHNIKWDIDKYDHCACVSVEDFIECYETIEKELKAFEVIKEKQVNVGTLIHHITDKYLLGLKSYNFMWCGTPERQLTQEEYDLLKEVML